MKDKTRYAYEKRIKELETKLNDLAPYKNLAIEIFNAILENHKQGRQTNEPWLIQKFLRVFK